jgi:hypothetical protein
LDCAYRHESNTNVRKIIPLIRQTTSDDEDIVLAFKEELHEFRALAYKWLRRFDE